MVFATQKSKLDKFSIRGATVAMFEWSLKSCMEFQDVKHYRFKIGVIIANIKSCKLKKSMKHIYFFSLAHVEITQLICFIRQDTPDHTLSHWQWKFTILLPQWVLLN